MNIQVTAHEITITQDVDVNSGEYNVTTCTFEFSDEYDNLTKIAIFSTCENFYKTSILNNECLIPNEVLENEGMVLLGVYGYEGDGDNLILRYSPTPKYFSVKNGSYHAGNDPELPSQSEWEHVLELINEAITETNNLDIEATKENHIATITITKKDGTSYDVEVLDGEQGPQGEQGIQGPQGAQGVQGPQGETGNGISSITKTSTSGLVDTYTITFTNGQTTTYSITNGANGDVVDVQVDGTSVVDNGIANITGINELKQTMEDLYNGWSKVSGTGTTISLSQTIKAKMGIIYKGNTEQNGTPTPDTPIPVQVVSGDNTITVSNSDNTQSTSYPISLGNIELCKIGDYQDKIDKSTGKNLFDKNNVNSSQIIPYDGSISASTNGKTLWISCKPNTTYTISKKVGTRFQVFTTQSVPSVGVSYSDYLSDATASHLTITTSANAKYLCIYYYHSSDTLTEQQILNSIQIEEGTQATSYEPYGKVWYLNKQIGKVVLDGSESETFTYELVNGYDAFKYNCNDMLRTNVGLGVSNYYHNTNGVSLFGDGIVRFGWFNYYIYFINDTSRFSGTISNFKTWLNTHNVITYFLLTTPTYTEITDTTLISQLEAIKTSYDGQTNISQTNNDLPFILDVSALKEMS